MTGIALVLLALWLLVLPDVRAGRPRTPRPRQPRVAGRRAPRRAAELADGARVTRELASLLRSGQHLDAALENLARVERETGSTGRALAVMRVQRAVPWSAGDQPESVGSEEAHPLWERLGWCIQVCAESGAPLAEVLDRLADDLEANLDALRGFEVAMAGPRATTRLLTWLPALGLAGAVLFGIDVAGAFTSSIPGQVSLVAGILLWLANRWWCRRLLRRCTERAVG